MKVSSNRARGAPAVRRLLTRCLQPSQRISQISTSGVDTCACSRLQVGRRLLALGCLHRRIAVHSPHERPDGLGEPAEGRTSAPLPPSGGRLSSIFDSYDLRARLAPAMLAGLPVAVVFLALAWASWPWAAIGIALEARLVVPLADVARDRGKRLEPGLWADWGGPPLATRLAVDDSTAIAARNATGHLLKSVVVPASAATRDVDRYTALADILRHQVRRLDGSDVVFAENASYGFQRNLLGMQPIVAPDTDIPTVIDAPSEQS